ncbi:hypothetical protein C4D60_Mb05t16720 [Musa balbisiana]|uniref:Uncharacterized protein n=1 Tax=Musa balbisiana TaxID=52838 RepID=A0A4S8JWP0_MUSBA|nr:hypothetical protein C4D60_Mb05t16720 [Musa balbisiana]
MNQWQTSPAGKARGTGGWKANGGSRTVAGSGGGLATKEGGLALSGREAAAAVEATGACGSRGTGGCSVYIAPQKQRHRRIARPKLQPRGTTATMVAAGGAAAPAVVVRRPGSSSGGWASRKQGWLRLLLLLLSLFFFFFEDADNCSEGAVVTMVEKGQRWSLAGTQMFLLG